MTKTLIGFGASSMQGAGDTEGGFFARTERLMGSRPYSRWINRGIGGNSTPAMLARASTVTTHAPYDLIVLLGCNDVPRANDDNLWNRTKLPDYEANLEQLLPRIKGEWSLFISSFPVSQEKTGVDPVVYTPYMIAATAIARKHGYEIWDLHNELQGRAEQYWAPDGVHFNPAGHEMLAKALAEKLRQWRGQ